MMKIVLFLALFAVALSNPGADSKVWIWKSVMPKVTPNIRARPFPEVATPPKMVIRKPGTSGTGKAAKCGKSMMASPAIVNGDEAQPHAYPWQAALFIEGGYFCGGSLISNEWVLTAGHCTTLANSIEVVLGAHNIRENEPTQVTIQSSKVITHESYNPYSLANDVGLVRLSKPVSFTSAIQPVCLPSHNDADLPANVMLTATGWGVTSDSSFASISPTLNEVTDPSMSNSDCKRYYGSTITDASICTSTKNGNKGTCSGDSGGPLNYVHGGVTYSRAVTSFVSSAGCMSGYPDGFTRTSHYLDWIQAQTGIAI